jgi:hypothetical protein
MELDLLNGMSREGDGTGSGVVVRTSDGNMYVEDSCGALDNHSYGDR